MGGLGKASKARGCTRAAGPASQAAITSQRLPSVRALPRRPSPGDAPVVGDGVERARVRGAGDGGVVLVRADDLDHGAQLAARGGAQGAQRAACLAYVLWRRGSGISSASCSAAARRGV